MAWSSAVPGSGRQDPHTRVWYLYIYIYIYIERERYTYIAIYIYIYTYIDPPPRRACILGATQTTPTPTPKIYQGLLNSCMCLFIWLGTSNVENVWRRGWEWFVWSLFMSAHYRLGRFFMIFPVEIFRGLCFWAVPLFWGANFTPAAEFRKSGRLPGTSQGEPLV